MFHPTSRSLFSIRTVVFSVVAAAFCFGTGRFELGWPPPAGVHPPITDPVLAIYLALVALGVVFLLGRTAPNAKILGLTLAADVLAIGILGTCLRRSEASGAFVPDAMPFLLSYLVASLVATIGRRRVAAFLGSLAGTMVLATGTWLVAAGTRSDPPLVQLGLQVILLLAGSIEAGVVMGWIGEEVDRVRLSERVERELQLRDTEAGELVAYAQALAASGTLPEVLDATLRYMRVHLPVRVRAIAVVTRGEVVAGWEEPVRFDAEQIERRRLHLQGALQRAGSRASIPSLDARSLGMPAATADLTYHSLIEAPILAGGQVVGVVLAADPRRHVIPHARIGILADMVRRTGEAIQRIERRTDEEHRRTGLLLHQMREGVLLLGSDGQILLANPAARDALRASKIHEDDPPAVGATALSTLATTPAGVTRRFRAEIRPQGAHRPVLLSCTAVGVLEGTKRFGTLITLSDVTEEELARGRLVQSEKLTLVGQTLAGVAHELNNPLAALIGYADVLDARKVPPELEKPVRQMREQAMRAARIVRNLLNFAKRRNPERLPTSVGELVQGVVELFAYEIRLNDIAMQVDVQPDLPPVLGDKHALQQILVNVVQNAIHALQDRTGDRRIAVAVRANADAIVVSMQDSGPGVPEDIRARVFEPFFTTKGAARGTGLGLALSRSIARDHGGDLSLEPNEGKGACFTLHLPIHRGSPTVSNGATTTTGLPKSESANGFHVLVVDDEPAVREALVAQLGRMGCRVDSAASAAEAQRHIVRTDHDAILLDVRMPGGSGLELHQRLLTEKPSAAAKVVFMTGDFTNDEVVKAIRETGNASLEKPFTLDELSRALHGRPGAPVADRRTSRRVTIGTAVAG